MDKVSITGFPNELATHEEKKSNGYAIKYSEAILNQWGYQVGSANAKGLGTLFRNRFAVMTEAEQYYADQQDMTKFKKIITGRDPNSGNATTLLSIDWKQLSIVSKFANILINKITQRDVYPDIQAVDPVSKTEKDDIFAELKFKVENKQQFLELQQMGVDLGFDPNKIPDSTEELEILAADNIKLPAEIAGQIAINLTLEWGDFKTSVYRRAIRDLVVNGLGVPFRYYDPSFGIRHKAVDPKYFLHSPIRDNNFKACQYMAHVEPMTISSLKRIAAGWFDEKEFEDIARSVAGRTGQNINWDSYDGQVYGYDECKVDVMYYEFKSADKMYFKTVQTKYGNESTYFKGFKAPSVFDEKITDIEVETIYCGYRVVGTDKVFSYGMKKNMPSNMYSIKEAVFSYFPQSENLYNMIPSSFVRKIIGFADQMQITHLKLQQSIAKAKPDGQAVDLEAMEDVIISKGQALQPIDIQDIYEQSGIWYYRSKAVDGSGKNVGITAIPNAIRNINELIALYNHNLNMIRDVTGINEVVDGSTPNSEALVGVRQQAIAASNMANLSYTQAANEMFKQVCNDILKCLQSIPENSILFEQYKRGIGMKNMQIIASFRDMWMQSFGLIVKGDMPEEDRAYVEANIQVSLSKGEIDLEDAFAVRRCQDVDQAERLLVIRRSKRMKMLQQQQLENINAQAQANAQVAQVTSQAKMQEIEMELMAKAELVKVEATAKAILIDREYMHKKELAMVEAKMNYDKTKDEQDFRKELEEFKQEKIDDRTHKQAVQQSEMVEQRKGNRGPVSKEELKSKTEEPEDDVDDLLETLLD